MSSPSDSRNGEASGSSSGSSRSFRPQYMTVGTGSQSVNTQALMDQLDRDSGYGTSIASDAQSNYQADWIGNQQDLMNVDIPLMPHGDGDSRRQVASHIHQLYYNQNRAALGRAINKAVDLLKGLKEMNMSWPAHYPQVQPSPTSPRHDRRPALTQSTTGLPKPDIDTLRSPTRPSPLRRATTSTGTNDAQEAESSAAAAKKVEKIPETLITPQAVQQFSILKLDLKLQGLTQSEIAHSMDRKAIASLLDGRINQSVRHLFSLRDRIEDTSSKVLVTGDLNAGKSTFCNALLRRKVLPEDQQPCTSIFCEVLDAGENSGVEEVHAVHKDAVYNRNDESTYDVFSLADLETLVLDNARYMQCKVYVLDIRSIDQSLLNNGVVDISIIDAPGLNSDSIKTTAVFARQEEIDVVVFVVSAANQFTLSAKEFIWNAANEKAYLFIVVNGYDNIRDKNRCQRNVLEQVAHLSPRTFKESSELVHFVSSNAVPVASGVPGSGPESHRRPSSGMPLGGGGGGGNDPNPSDDADEGDDMDAKEKAPRSDRDKGKGKDREKIADFENLETALRRFVLEKRARSKLAPAKTYLVNVLSDLITLASVNRDVASSELDRVEKELSQLEPAFQNSQKANSEVADEVDKMVESSTSDVYQHVRDVLTSAISKVSEQELGVPYPGLWYALQYADDIKEAILAQISETLVTCEDEARTKAVNGVDSVNQLGRKYMGDEYEQLNFRSNLMFRKRRDAAIRQIDMHVDVLDFVDFTSLWDKQEKLASTGMVVTAAGVVGTRLMGGVGWFDGVLGAAKILGTNNLRKLVVPGLIGAVILGAAYVLHSIPVLLPRRLSQRIANSLSQLEYTHNNALRISNEVGNCMRVPAENLRVGLRHTVEKLRQQREETLKTKKESEVARKYFSNLVRESNEGRRAVEAVDLEGGPAGMGHS